MFILVALMVIALVLVVLFYPLFQPQKRERDLDEASESSLAALLERRDAAYAAIRELEFDYSLGNIAPEDYQELLNRYQLRAAAVLKALDDSYGSLEKDLEGEIKARRGPRKAVAGVGLFCPQCGAPHREGDGFCSRCGGKLQRQDAMRRAGKAGALPQLKTKDRKRPNGGRSR